MTGGKEDQSSSFVLNISKIYKDSIDMKIISYSINGNSYVKLQDIAQAFNIGVTDDTEDGSIFLQVNWDEWAIKNANPDKIWRVKFNQQLDNKTVNKENIYVRDPYCNNINVNVVLDKNNNDTIIVTPIINYRVQSEYYLYITQNVKSINGKDLKRPISMKFKIID